MLCSKESDDRESIDLGHCYSAQFRLERGIWTREQFLLFALDRVRNSSDHSDSSRMLQHPKASSQCHLAKMGIIRKAHRSVVFGTAQFGGLGLEHLAAYQGHSCLQYLMGHLRCNITTRKLMRSMLDYTQL
jgi:hypothetical protein